MTLQGNNICITKDNKVMMSLNLPANNGYPERKIENGKQGKQYEETVQTPKKKRRKMGRNMPKDQENGKKLLGNLENIPLSKSL